MSDQASAPRATRDWGNAAADYAKFRHGFPQSFYDRLASMDLIRPGIRCWTWELEPARSREI